MSRGDTGPPRLSASRCVLSPSPPFAAPSLAPTSPLAGCLDLPCLKLFAGAPSTCHIWALLSEAHVGCPITLDGVTIRKIAGLVFRPTQVLIFGSGEGEVAKHAHYLNIATNALYFSNDLQPGFPLSHETLQPFCFSAQHGHSTARCLRSSIYLPNMSRFQVCLLLMVGALYCLEQTRRLKSTQAATPHAGPSLLSRTTSILWMGYGVS